MGVVVPENVGSWRVLKKIGMRYEGLADYYGLTGLKKIVPRSGDGGTRQSPPDTH